MNQFQEVHPGYMMENISHLEISEQHNFQSMTTKYMNHTIKATNFPISHIKEIKEFSKSTG